MKSDLKAKRRKPRKGNSAPGVMAKEAGTRLKRGAATQVMIYPRPRTKAIFVRASKLKDLSLSSYVIRAAANAAAYDLGYPLNELIPEEEIKQYR